MLKRCEYLALVKDPLGYTPAMSKRQNKIMDRPYEDVEKYCKMYQDSDILTMVYDVFAKGEVSKKLPCSVDFPYGGYSVLRDGWTKDSMYAFMKYSRYAPGHKHEDSNAIVITAFGKRLLIDSGNYNYSDDTLSTEINNYMQSSAAHNTMDIDGLSQARLYIGRNIAVDERFPDSTTNDIEYEKYRKIISLHDAECEGRRIHTERFDFVEGIYSDGYYNISSNDGFVEGKHIRRVLFIKGLGYIIDDELSVKDNDKHTFNQHWNFAEDFEPEDFVLGDNLIVAKRSDNVNIGIWNFTDGDMLYDIKYGSKEPVSGWCATEYGHMVKSVDITASLKKSKKVRIISFIYPFIGEKNYIKIIKHEPYYFEVLLKNKRLEIDSRDMKFDVKVNGETLRLN